MRSVVVRAVVLVSSLAPMVAACGDATGPGDGAEPVIVETPRFVLIDNATTPRSLLDSLGARLEAEYDRVGTLLPEFTPPPTPISFTIREGGGIPFVTIEQNAITQWREDLAPEYFSHQIAHLYTRYVRTNFIEEGIAVYVTEELMLEGETPNPFRRQPSHAWVSLFEQHNSTISLFTALRASNLSYNYDGSSPDASAWQMFLEAGSFTRWLIERHGRDAWLEFYLTGNLGGVLGQDTPEIERTWLTDVTGAFPDPLPCEEALGQVGSREEFWCQRATGN